MPFESYKWKYPKSTHICTTWSVYFDMCNKNFNKQETFNRHMNMSHKAAIDTSNQKELIQENEEQSWAITIRKNRALSFLSIIDKVEYNKTCMIIILFFRDMT